jgi:hypothetical protein
MDTIVALDSVVFQLHLQLDLHTYALRDFLLIHGAKLEGWAQLFSEVGEFPSLEYCRRTFGLWEQEEELEHELEALHNTPGAADVVMEVVETFCLSRDLPLGAAAAARFSR